VSGTAYVPTPVQSGEAGADVLAAWLLDNEHQALDLLKITLLEYGYSKARIMAAYIIYVDKTVP
jgi:hypothetical protein